MPMLGRLVLRGRRDVNRCNAPEKAAPESEDVVVQLGNLHQKRLALPNAHRLERAKTQRCALKQLCVAEQPAKRIVRTDKGDAAHR